jgi:hypothetical protein
MTPYAGVGMQTVYGVLRGQASPDRSKSGNWNLKRTWHAPAVQRARSGRNLPRGPARYPERCAE